MRHYHVGITKNRYLCCRQQFYALPARYCVKLLSTEDYRFRSNSTDVDRGTISFNALQECYFSVYFYICWVQTVSEIVCYIYIFPILLSMNCHSDYNTSDSRMAGNRRPYPDIFQRSRKSLKVHELCRSTVALRSTGSVDSTDSDFGITP